MPGQLIVTLGQATDKGRKETNQDFHGACIPQEPQLSAKGLALAIADGISSSDVSQLASETAVTGFLADYFSTSETWSVKKSAHQVLMATNSWLHSQTSKSDYRYDKDKGYVCTFSALVIKSTTAHIFHLGDSRLYLLREQKFRQLTNDHRIRVSDETSYLSRALGINPQLEIDYETLPVETGDIFILATDGVYEFVSHDFIRQTIDENIDDLDQAAQLITEQAYARDSTDNLTIQILRIDALPALDSSERYQQLTRLPFAPLLQPREQFDGFTIVREIHVSSRSHLYLASVTNDPEETLVVLKFPSVDQRNDAAYLERFLLEEWIARRINNPHVLKPSLPNHQRNYLYLVMEYIQGQTLTQWMADNPQPDLAVVRAIIEQIATGLQAFHRLEMLHQDLRPDNIMIDRFDIVKIIDFGSTRVAGLAEIDTLITQHHILGTAQYSAPEYFLGESGTSRSDIFSLGVIAYQMLSGKLPYGTQVAKIKSRSGLNKLHYKTLLTDDVEFPAWVDDVIKTAVHPDPFKRYSELSEFIFDLRKPSQRFLNKTRPPLMERDPVGFWKGISLTLCLIIIYLLIQLSGTEL